MTSYFRSLACLLAACLWVMASTPGLAASSGASLFGYKEQQNSGFEIFPLWNDVLKRHASEVPQAQGCQGPDCPSFGDWQRFLQSLTEKPVQAQISAVNSYANRHRYVLDMNNYGVLDYWATARQFLVRDGDCEDYAITKYASLRQLGINPDMMRIVVVQDTNLRIAHAVLALYTGNDVLILDNQIPEVTSHRAIAHYVPVYSINERNWWMHLP